MLSPFTLSFSSLLLLYVVTLSREIVMRTHIERAPFDVWQSKDHDSSGKWLRLGGRGEGEWMCVVKEIRKRPRQFGETVEAG